MRRIGRVLAVGMAMVVAPLTAAAETVTIAAEDAFPPWSLPDGRGAGNEIVREAFRRQGVTVELAVVPYARCRRAVITGDVAACLSMGDNEGTRREVLLPAPSLAQIRAVLVTDGARPQAALTGCDPAQWRQRPRLGIVNGYEYPAEWEAMAASGRAELVTVQSDSTGLRMLGAGRLDGMVLLFDQLRTPDGLMRRAGQSFPLVSLCPLGGLTTYLGFSTSRPDSAALLRRFEDGYAALQADGTLDAILGHWRDREDGPPGN